jgi:hypothetical protein
MKTLINYPFFLKAAGVLKLNSYWFLSIQKATSAVIKEFQKTASSKIKGFLKPLALTKFRRFRHTVSSGFSKPIMNISGFWELFYDNTSGFQVNQQKLVGFFKLLNISGTTMLKNLKILNNHS